MYNIDERPCASTETSDCTDDGRVSELGAVGPFADNNIGIVDTFVPLE